MLTLERPDIWHRGLALATALTGYEYAPKLPLADGTIYACGYSPPPTKKDYERGIEQTEQRKKEWIDWDPKTDPSREEWKRRHEESNDDFRKRMIREIDERIERMKQDRDRLTTATVFVPPGAMEWLLHEVGHWLAATPAERALSNYGLGQEVFGHDGDRELQAWAFEEIVLAPQGPAREFAPPTQRDGAGFLKAGPLPQAAMRHAELRIVEAGVDVAAWRAVFDEWVRHERRKSDPSWKRIS